MTEKLKEFKKKLAKKGGFTLVELIVVIAILGILAGVAIPTYSGYIKKANEAADYTQLDAIKTATVFAAVESNVPKDTVVTKIVVTENSNTVTYDATIGGTSATGKTVDISDYCTVGAFKSDATTATWTAASEAWTLS